MPYFCWKLIFTRHTLDRTAQGCAEWTSRHYLISIAGEVGRTREGRRWMDCFAQRVL